MFEEIINSVANTYNWKNYYTPFIKKEIFPPDSLLQGYLGKFKLDNDTLAIIKKADGIYLVVGDDVNWKIHFTDYTHSFFFEQQIEPVFMMDHSKKITGFTIGKQTAKRIE